jgi:uncharacterized protein
VTPKNEEIEMFLAGLVLDPASNAPIVILKNATGERCLPIWIGLAEATAIASALKKVELARPLTHDLLVNMLRELNASVSRIVIGGLHENTFIAVVEMRVGDVVHSIDARPSDAIAIAIREEAPIYVASEVLDKAQVTLVAVNPEDMDNADLSSRLHEMEDTNFANIEKDKWAEILAEMDPDDFKYKM